MTDDKTFEDKVRDCKYYAYYNGSAEYELLSKKEYEEILSEQEKGNGCREYFRVNMQGFKTLKEAKDYLLSNLLGEKAEIIESIARIRAKRFL